MSAVPLSPSLSFGLAGCGRWGLLVLRDLRALGVSVVVADPSAQARAAAEALGVSTVDRIEALPPVEALVVATPAVTHTEVVEALLPRGVPMLVEKPFTTDVGEAERLVAAGGDRLFVGHVWRYHPGVEMLGAMARSGEIGPIAGLKSTRANWTSPRTDVDSVWNLAPHDLTLAIEILGHIPTPRAAIAEVHDGHAVGLSALLGDTPWLSFDVSNRYRDKRREVRLHGRDGVAVMRDPDAGQIELTRGGIGAPGTPAVELRDYSRESALRRQLMAFIGAVRGGPPPKSNAAEGLAVIRALVRLRDLAGLA